MLRTRREITALRLSAQRIASPPATTVAETVRFMLALQAQDLPGARWSVGLRTRSATDLDVGAALASGEVVRSWPMRGTLHLVAPEDLAWMLRLTRPRQATFAATRRRALAITDDELAAAGRIARAALEGGRVERRDTLLGRFDAAGIPTTGQRGYHLLWNLAQDGLTVFGPPDGAQPTFALFDEWIGVSRELEDDEALGEFAARYVASHGPATDRDFAWWSSLTLGQARRGLDIARMPSLERGGERYYLAEGLEPAKRSIHLLPGFDEFILGYQDRSAPLAPEFAPRIVPGNNGIFQPTLVVGGLVEGTWRRASKAQPTTVEIDPFGELSATTRSGIDSAARRLGRFLGTPVVTR
ncbi:winged helix DNA-binding domain-containing protein [Schumannella luteola]